MGVANSVLDLLPAGGHRNLHPAPTPGDADLRGDQGQGADDQKPLEGGLPEFEYQIHTDRHHRADRAGCGLVQRSVLGLVLPAAGLQGGPAEYRLHRGSRAAPRDAELDLSWLGAVTQPGKINYPIAIFIIFILVCYVGMVYVPVGAFLAEFFPGRIRYTSVSV